MTATREQQAGIAHAAGQAVAQLRQMLRGVTRVTVTARSAAGPLFRGSGDVSVRPIFDGGLSIAEGGEWASTGGPKLRFSNAYQWQFDETRGTVRLAHTRFGDDKPVHLADLVPVGGDHWASESPHICRSDTYLARVRIVRTAVLLCWRVAGPHKCQIIRSVYHAAGWSSLRSNGRAGLTHQDVLI